MDIYALFSVENNYDQPQNNLVAWWGEKPSFDILAKAVGYGCFPCATDEGTLIVVNLWQGGEVKDDNGTSYRLRLISDGIVKETR